MADFDIVSKRQVQKHPEDFARLCLNRTDFTLLEVITPEQPTVEMHQADILIKVEIDGNEALLHFEFQTTDSYNPSMPLRMAGYIMRVVETYELPVYSNVIYLRPEAGRNDPGHYRQNLPKHRILIEYQVLRLINMDGQQVLDTKSPGLLPFAPLMGHAADIDSEEWLRRCVQAADSIDAPNKPEYLAGMAVLGNLVYEPQTLLNIISEETMQESTLIQYLTEKAAAEAHQQGIEQGEKVQALKDIFAALTLRLPSDAVLKFKPTLEKIDDLQRLEELFHAAVLANTTEDFQQVLETKEN